MPKGLNVNDAAERSGARPSPSALAGARAPSAGVTPFRSGRIPSRTRSTAGGARSQPERRLCVQAHRRGLPRVTAHAALGCPARGFIHAVVPVRAVMRERPMVRATRPFPGHESGTLGERERRVPQPWQSACPQGQGACTAREARVAGGTLVPQRGYKESRRQRLSWRRLPCRMGAARPIRLGLLGLGADSRLLSSWMSTATCSRPGCRRRPWPAPRPACSGPSCTGRVCRAADHGRTKCYQVVIGNKQPNTDMQFQRHSRVKLVGLV